MEFVDMSRFFTKKTLKKMREKTEKEYPLSDPCYHPPATGYADIEQYHSDAVHLTQEQYIDAALKIGAERAAMWRATSNRLAIIIAILCAAILVLVLGMIL